jgi:hypothetical protein
MTVFTLFTHIKTLKNTHNTEESLILQIKLLCLQGLQKPIENKIIVQKTLLPPQKSFIRSSIAFQNKTKPRCYHSKGSKF